jgi:hypothetical protein
MIPDLSILLPQERAALPYPERKESDPDSKDLNSSVSIVTRTRAGRTEVKFQLSARKIFLLTEYISIPGHIQPPTQCAALAKWRALLIENNHKILCPTPYHAKRNPVELIWATVAKSVAEMSHLRVGFVLKDNWKHRCN